MKEHQRHLTGRRGVLAGLGIGSVLLAPFASSRLSFASPAQTANILIWFTPNGMRRSAFGAEGSQSQFALKSSLTPLEPFKDDIVVIKGLCHKGQSAQSTHSDAMKLLICRYGSGERYKGNGPSFDHVMAKSIGQTSIFTHAMPDVKGAGTMSGLSWSAADAQRSLTSDPKALFGELFSGIVAGGGSTAGDASRTVAALAAENKSLLDFIREDVSLFKTRLSRADRARLDIHLESLRALEKEVTAEPAAPQAGTCDPQAAMGSLAASDAATAENLAKNGAGKVRIIANALACGVRRVAVLIWQNASAGINPVGGGGNHHDITHGGPGATQERIDRWYAERFAETLSTLKAHGQLDNTMVFWCTDTSEAHNQNNS